ncbi:MAG TPA: CDP-diacylglycerol--glycerol-3-phosphate 3-phosphatidyltransferase [Wenzhouxiangella sp.]
MRITIPTMLTLVRIAMIPILVLVFYLPWAGANQLAVLIFVLAALTDWADGWVARKFEMSSRLGAFLDPVADKLMVAVALVLIVQANPDIILAVAGAVIIGREITVSALREWMAIIGESAQVKVQWIGKLKTTAQMVAIGFCLYGEPLFALPILAIGEVLLIVAAGLTLVSMSMYLRAAWPALRA